MSKVVRWLERLLDVLELARGWTRRVLISLFGHRWRTLRHTWQQLARARYNFCAWWLEMHWWHFSKRLFVRAQKLRLPLPMLAASLAYYAAFSLAPLLLIIAGALGFLLRNRPDVTAQYRAVLVDLLAQVMPLESNSAQLAERGFDSLVAILQQGAVINGIISLIFLIWVSSNFFSSLQLALEIIFNTGEQRGFWRKRIVALIAILAVGAVIAFEVIGALLLTSVAEVFVQLEAGVATFGLPLALPNLSWGLGLISTISRFVLAAITFTLCFRYLPRRSSTWRGAIIGGLFSVVALIVARRMLFVFFNIDQFNLIYGLVTRLLAILLWLYMSLMLFLIGALITAEVSQVNREAASSDVPSDATSSPESSPESSGPSSQPSSAIRGASPQT